MSVTTAIFSLLLAGGQPCAVRWMLGDAGAFNVFVRDFVEHASSDTEGRMAIGGGLSGGPLFSSVLQSYRLGGNVPYRNRWSLLVNGPLTFQYGTIENGS